MAALPTISETESEQHRDALEALAGLFFDNLDRLAQFQAVSNSVLPPTYATLLAHEGHMTVTLEAFHESLVDVHTVAEEKSPEFYARQSLLTRQSDGAVVQCGIMKIALSGLPQNVRDSIENHSAPLGRILIRNNLLREVQLIALWKMTIGEALAKVFDRPVGDTVYGRSACIHLDGQPAVDLLEIVTDDPRKAQLEI